MSANLYHKAIVPSTDRFFRFALSFLKDGESAKDAVQDCLAKIWKKRQSLDQVDNPEAWALKIVRNHCLDMIKVRRHTEDLDESWDLPGSQSSDFDLLYQDQKRWLEMTLSRLPEKQREVFHLREVEEQSYQEIADIMGITLNDVKVNLNRARKKIKMTLEKAESYGV